MKNHAAISQQGSLSASNHAVVIYTCLTIAIGDLIAILCRSCAVAENRLISIRSRHGVTVPNCLPGSLLHAYLTITALGDTVWRRFTFDWLLGLRDKWHS